MTRVLGIGASHNGAACLADDSGLVVAVQEERLSRRTKDRVHLDRRSLSVAYCLDAAGVGPEDLDVVVGCTQRPMDLPENDLARHPVLGHRPHLRISHHLGHALHAAAASGFGDTAVLVVDGMGSPRADLDDPERRLLEPGGSDVWETVSVYNWRRGTIVPVLKHGVTDAGWLRRRDGGMPGFGSLGGLFSACARQIFAETTAAGKVMGLAAYGSPTIPVSEFFTYEGDRLVFSEQVPARFDDRAPWPAHEAEYATLAASAQAALQEGVLHLARAAMRSTGSTSLCLAGGVALNGLANEAVIRAGLAERVYVTPAAEDNGTAIGAVVAGFRALGAPIPFAPLTTDSLGVPYPVGSARSAARTVPSVRTDASDPVDEAVRRLTLGQIGGLFSGGSEFGPRALGHRSIVADPRDPAIARRLNRHLKGREPFRPFAPAVLLDHVEDWFELDGVDPVSPYMLRVMRFRPDRARRVPGVVHADGTGRVQTVTPASGLLYEVLTGFHCATGVPMLLNTSFNVAGEPIVETPQDALWCLFETELRFCLFPGLLATTEPERSPDLLDYVPVAATAAATQPDRCSVSTPWGPLSLRLIGDSHRLMTLCDGSRRGHEVRAAWETETGTAAAPDDLTAAMRALRRRGLLAFRDDRREA